MTDAVLTLLVGILIVSRNLSREMQLVVGVVLIVLGLLGYGVSHLIK